MTEKIKTTAYKCEVCDYVSLKESTAKRHEKKCIAEREIVRNRELMTTRSFEIHNSAKSPEELLRGLKEAVEEVYNVEFEKFVVSLEYNELVSNSHAAPVNGVRNFTMMRDNDRPIGYEGFKGFLTYETKEASPRFNKEWICASSFSTERTSLLHTGSGSAGSHKGRYNLYFFLDDYPLIKKHHKKESNIQKLHNNPTPERVLDIIKDFTV